MARGRRHLEAGVWGERAAAGWLRHKGLKVLGTRVRVGGRDEIDLVAREGEVLVFVEVKTRAGEAFGRPAEAVDRTKRRNLSRAVVRFVKNLKRKPDYIRCDVVEVVGEPGDASPVIRHIENAFTLDPRYRLQW